MTTNSYYEASEHIFYSENQNDVYIRAKDGQNLNIQGTISGITGTNGSVQYNNNNMLAGDTNFIYDPVSYIAKVPTLRTNTIQGTNTSNSLGFNEITRPGFYTPQTLITSKTTTLRSLGTDVNMAKDSNYVAFACPWYIFGASQGGTSVWSGVSNVFSEYSSALGNINFTTEASVNYTSINEDGSLCAVSSLDQINNVSIHRRTGATWAPQSSFSGVQGCKFSTNYLFYYDANSNFRVHFYNGSSWALQSNILLGTGGSIDYPLAFPNDSTVIFYYLGQIRIYNRSGTSWTINQNITLASVSSIDASGTILCAVASGILYIYDNYILRASLAIPNAVYATTNGTYVFVSTNTNRIYIAKEALEDIWQLSFNYTDFTGAKKLSCNNTYLAVGAPTIGTFGTGIMYIIAAYVNYDLAVSEIIQKSDEFVF